jgi:hypothetical protein
LSFSRGTKRFLRARSRIAAAEISTFRARIMKV